MGKEAQFMSTLLVASIAFALFILCPRMAGMANVISNATEVDLVKVAVLGTLLSLPLIICMALVFRTWGLWAALAFCVFTDLLAAVTMREISIKAGLETFVVAVFVVVGVRVATMLSAKLP